MSAQQTREKARTLAGQPDGHGAGDDFVLACRACPATTPVTDRALLESARLYPDNAARRRWVVACRTATDAGWAHDALEQHWLCPPCASTIAADRGRAHPCPTWCDDCAGYDFDVPGVTHRRSWRNTEAVLFAQVSLVVYDDRSEGKLEVDLFDPGSPCTAADLRSMAQAATAVADFLTEHDLEGMLAR